MPKRFAFIGLSLALGLSSSAFAQTKTNLDGTTNIPSTAVPFLRISPDARAGGMGDAGIAVAPDANAQYWNVAKIPFCEKNYGISATYTPWLKDLVPDIFLAYISGYAKFGQDGSRAISASMRYFSLGNINYTDFNANPTGTGMPREFSFDVGYSQKLSTYLSTGVSLRYIHSDIAAGASGVSDYKPGNAFAADIGLYYTKTKELDEFRKNTLSFGAVLSNAGSKISYSSLRSDPIPVNLGIGGAFTSQFDAYNKVTVALDINKLLVPASKMDSAGGVIYSDQGVVSGIFNSFGDPAGVKRLDVSLGLEYWYQNQFAARVGYFYENPDNGDRRYFTAGLGVRYNVFALNFSYLIPSGSGITRNPLSNTVRFTLMFEFDKLQKAADNGESSTTE